MEKEKNPNKGKNGNSENTVNASTDFQSISSHSEVLEGVVSVWCALSLLLVHAQASKLNNAHSH